MTVTEKLFTAEDLARLPEPVNGGKLELVAGRVVEMAPPFGDHSLAQANMFGPIDAFIRKHDLGRAYGEAGFKLFTHPDTVRAPDLAFLSWSRLGDRRAPRSYFPITPDLAIEVKSSDDTEPEVLGKVAEYLEAGSQRVWVVRPVQRTVAVHYPDGTVRVFREGEVLTSAEAGFEVDGFELPMADVFALL